MSLAGFKELKKNCDSALPVFNGFVSALGARQELKDSGILIENNQFSLYGMTFKFYLSFYEKEGAFAIDMENSASDRGGAVLFRFTFGTSIFLANAEKLIYVSVTVPGNQLKPLGQIDYDKFITPDSDNPMVIEFINTFLNWLYKVYNNRVLKVD